MTERIDQQITALRKSGKIDEAAELARRSLESEPDNFYIRSAMAWVLYEKVKSAAESLKEGIETKNEVSSGAVSTIESALDEYLGLSLPVPDLSLSLILSRLSKPVGRNIPNFSVLLSQIFAKSNEIYRDEDTEPYLHEHGASPSLQTKIAREFAAWSLHDQMSDDNHATLTIKLLEQANNNDKEVPQNKIWVNYDLSKIHSKLGDTENAIEYAKQTVRQKKQEWWAWHWLGRLYFGRSNDKAIACLCEAINCPHEEDKIGKLRLDLAALLKHAGDTSGAITECLFVAETYEGRGWKFPEKLNDAMNADWFDSSLARDSNEEIYERYADDAIEITYDGIEEIPANFLRRVEAQGSGKPLVVFATQTGSASFQQVRPARVIGQMILEVGDPVFLIVAVEDDHEHTLRCKQRAGEPFDCLAVRDGVVGNHSRDGAKAGVYLSEKENTVIRDLDSEDMENLPVGHGVKVWVSKNQKNQHLECFRAEATDSVPKLKGLEKFGGILRGSGGEFGFVEDTFVPRSLMDPLLVGNLVQGLKVLSFNKTKNQPGWKAISLEPLAD